MLDRKNTVWQRWSNFKESFTTGKHYTALWAVILLCISSMCSDTAGYAIPVDTSGLGLYLSIRYALSFVLICASSWMLVAMVSKKILSTQVEDDTEIKPLGESDQNVDSTEQKRHSNFSSVILIVTILIAAILLHGVKFFEYQTSSESDTPWLMKKRLNGFEYELYTVITNIAVTMIAPYMFLLISTAHYIAEVVRIIMRKKSEREPNRNIWLLFLLGLLHLVCYGPSLYQQMFLLFTKMATSANICLDNFNSALIILNASVKIVLFKLFTNHFNRYQLPLSNLSGFLAKRNLSLKRGDVVRNFNYSFSNPSYEQDKEQRNPSYEQDREQHNPSYEQDREQHNPSYEQDREQHNPSYEQDREQQTSDL
ncbi:uncharacterized protein [Argopecten irradians]|uniref:uncharacterized protein isoform X2 n=1 Tax=Argopecten irradians TaxID=31199 RepID=UPI0037187E54